MSDPIVYGSIYPIQLNDKLTAHRLSPNDIKANNLFFETLEYILKEIDPTFSAEDIKQTVNEYLKDNKYNYEEAKKLLFDDLDNHIKELKP